MIEIEYLEEEMPVYDITVEKNHNFFANDILVHNCTEVMLPTKPLKVLDSKIETDFNFTKFPEKRELEGEIGICNLSSVNLMAFDAMSEEEKERFTYSLLLGMDNNIEYSDYPVKAGERFNKLHRAVGIGPTNWQNWLASKGCKVSDEKAKQLTHEIMESLSYYLTKASIRLAAERGKYYYFEGSKWEKGEFIHESAQLPEHLNYPLKYDWEKLRKDLLKYGVRFEFLMALAPGATSSLVLNFTEGASLIRQFKTIKEGTYNIPFLAPNLLKHRKYYELAWDVDMDVILEQAAIRQKFMDQGQSVDIMVKDPDKASNILKILLKAEQLGLKSLYYLNTLKKGETDEECESCSV